MSDLKRRPLGNNNNNQQNRQPNRPQQNRGPGQSGQPSGQQNNQGQRQRPPQRGNAQNPQGQQQNRNQNQNRNQQGPQRGNNNRPQQRPVQRPKAPPPPPAFMQRDILLVAATIPGVEEVRLKLDPLAKKIPAHITILSPEPSKGLSEELLKTCAKENLPSLATLTFNQITIHDEMYLWLVPDEEGKEKILAWRTALLNHLTTLNAEHTQELEPFVPHITLGYIPRSLSPEDAIAFTKNLIATPLAITFEKFLLEEFSENQVSTQVDALSL